VVDVLVVGAGPAGAVAATVAARAGASVLLVDRAGFPRDKLCGDTVNPGALTSLRALGLAGRVEARGLPLDGMVLTSREGDRVEGTYGRGIVARTIRRRDLDLILVEQAVAAGARFEDGVVVSAPVVERTGDDRVVRGARLKSRTAAARTVRARVTIAADGRRSGLAIRLGLIHQPRRPRRWVAGGYFEGIRDLGRFGEMHIRPSSYIGVAPIPGGVANVCVVTASRHGWDEPSSLLTTTVERDPVLGPRFERAGLTARAVSMGPLAVDAHVSGVPGLLLAGDASGFIDPMTGDGLCFAIRGGALAARAALATFAEPRDGPAELDRLRRSAFARKHRFNRSIRALVGYPAGVRLGTLTARVAPMVLRWTIRYAGDVAGSRAGESRWAV